MTRNAITTIPFHGANILVKPGQTPEATMVAMKPVVEGMGLDWTYQFRKITGHPVLSTCVAITAMQMPGDNQERDHTFLPLNRLHFWLATIHPDRIKDEHVRARVILYQTEAADVLFDHFFGRALGHTDDRSERQLGISKMTIHKVTNLEKQFDHLLSRVEGMLITVDARRAALEYVSVKELLAEASALQRRRGRLNRKIGSELRQRALVSGPPSPCRRCPHSGVWLFQRDFAEKYMKDRGLALVADHNSAQVGQSVIKFPKSGKPQEDK
jgi:hypothetical protein